MQRVSIGDIQQGVVKGNQLAEMLGNTVFAVGWFRKHILKHAEKRKSAIMSEIRGRFEFDCGLFWFYPVWLKFKEGENISFDCWGGPLGRYDYSIGELEEFERTIAATIKNLELSHHIAEQKGLRVSANAKMEVGMAKMELEIVRQKIKEYKR
jgi:hypothetical protein